jgi:hypothetical protein
MSDDQSTHDRQVTLRIGAGIERALREYAREQRVPKSQVVREALRAYLAVPSGVDASTAWKRVAPMVGSLSLDPAEIERDSLARQIRAHNWRT